MYTNIRGDLKIIAIVLAASVLIGAIVFFTYKVTDEEVARERQAAETSYLLKVSEGGHGNVIGQRDEILKAGWQICATDRQEVRLRSQVMANRDPLWQDEAVAAYGYLCPTK